MTDLLIKWATRARPELFRRTFEKWNVPGVRFVVSLDEDDPTLARYTAFLADKPNVRTCVGKSSCKVEAINRDLDGESFGIIVCASDDMVPQTIGWADRIKALMAQQYPDTDGVIHLNDGRRGIGLNTLSILGKRYYDRFGYLYHPAYRSLWCDDEFTAVSYALDRATYFDEVLIAHDWIGQHAPDELHKRNERHFHDDAKTYERRRKAGFPVSELLNIGA
jgi:hypothetical protein